MLCLSPLVLLLLAELSGLGSSSEATTSAAFCQAGDERADCRERGSILLQVGSDSSLLKTRVADRVGRTAVAESRGDTRHDGFARTVSVADETLAEYTRLKETLSQSKESADIMRKIDHALDSGLDEKRSASSALDAETLDDVLKVQDSATSANSEARSSAESKRKRVAKKKHVAKKVAKHRENIGVSLLEASATESLSPRKHPAADDESGEDEGEESADAESSSEESTDDEEFDNEEGSATEEESEETDEEEEEDSSTDEEEDEDEDEEDISMVAVRDMMAADREALDESGYLDVAESRSNRKMERFVERLAEEMSLEIVDVGGLKGMVPYYSGQKSTQSYMALRSELRSTSHMRDGWLVKRKRRENILLQTDTTEHEKNATQHEASPAGAALSLLGTASTRASRVAHKVPDLAVAMFGSRTLVLGCTMCLVAILFCLDEKKRTKGAEYEDLLNMSPTPPSAKEDPVVAATLKLLRGAKSDLAGPQ